MKKFFALIATVAVLSVAASSFAQAAGPKGGGAPGQGPGAARPGGMRMGMMMGGRMKETREKVLAKLNLSADQKSKIKKLDTDTQAQMTKLIGAPPKAPAAGGNKAAKPGQPAGGGNGNRIQLSPEKREAVMKVMQGYQTKFNAILTPKQKTEFDKQMKVEFDKMRQQRGGGAPGSPAKPGAKAGAKPGAKGGGR